MADYTDLKSEFEEVYKLSDAGWSSFIQEAMIDFGFYLGKQWDAKQLAYLKGERRNALVFNKIRRIIKIITGYERRNRLALKIGPVGFEDDQAATQLTNVVMDAMTNGNGELSMSRAFECGMLVTGVNLIEPFLLRTGDIRIKRIPHNRFLLDPCFAELDYSDGRHLLRREMVTKEEAKLLLPNNKGDIDKLNFSIDNKYPLLTSDRKYSDTHLAYDEYWKRTTRTEKTIVNKQNGLQQPYNGTDAQLGQIMQQYPFITAFEKQVATVELNVFAGNELMYKGPCPMGLDDFRFVLLLGFYYPEFDDDKYKLQGIVRALRDPQTEFNKRISQELDIIESQITSGYDAIEGSVVNEESLYQSGQGKVTWIKNDAQGGLDSIRKKQTADIPQGLFQLNQSLDTLLTEIPGINNELFGTEEKDIPGVLSKLRQGGALTTLQDIFDNYRNAKKTLGKKLIQIIQRNYPPQKVFRITNEPVNPDFYKDDLCRYDCNPTEGLLSDTQREMYYAELKALKDSGAPIPWTAIFDAAPIQMKNHLRKHIEMAEKAQEQAAAQQMQQQQLTQQLMQAQIASDLSSAEERRTQAQENRTGAALDRAKTMAEIQKIKQENFSGLVETANSLMPQKKEKKITRR